MTDHGIDRRLALTLAGGGLGALLLAGCQSGVHRTTWPDITFAHRDPIPLGVYGTEFVDAAGPAEVAPPAHDISFALPVSPVATMERWSRQRLQALGGYGTAVVSVTENRFVEVPLDTTAGVEGLFNNSQSERYEGALAVKVAIEGDPSGSGFASARATASRTVPEDFNIEQREQALWDLVAGIVRAVDQRLEQEIRANLGRWVVPA